MSAPKYLCRLCRKSVTATKNDRYRTHYRDEEGNPRCDNSAEPIPEDLLVQPDDGDPGVPKEGLDYATCPQCGRRVELTQLGYFPEHATTLKGGDRCEVSGVRAKHARKTDTIPLPGDPVPDPGAAIPEVTNQEEMEASPGSTTTSPAFDVPPPSTSSDAPSSGPDDATAPEVLFLLAPAVSEVFSQPFSPFSQPGEIPPTVKLADAMSEHAKEIVTRLKETFYAYTNRNSSDNRSAQTTLGPSEIGTPCDRQLAMKLLGIAPSNPQEGWAPFVGTAVHAELAKMFDWADGGSGRYVTEMRVEFGSSLVPYGTLDLLDRVLYMIDDHKLMGRYSLKKLVEQGPSETYRQQIQCYGLGAERAGEKVKYVAIIAWPRQESSLDNLYVHVEPYDRKVAQAALDRVERITQSVSIRKEDRATYAGLTISEHDMAVAKSFPTGDDCKWCPFHLKGDKEMKRGCPGK